MNINTENPAERLVIPRWREYKNPTSLREIEVHTVPGSVPPIVSCSVQINNWNNNPTITNAIALVNSAITCGDYTCAIGAAEFIQSKFKDANDPFRLLTDAILRISPLTELDSVAEGASVLDDIHLRVRGQIVMMRDRIRLGSVSPIVYIDYARLLTIFGEFRKAERAIRTALHLAPNNVFVIRCAVRFFIHQSKYNMNDDHGLQKALLLLKNNAATRSDPRLLATEIALNSLLRRTSSNIKEAKRIVDGRNFRPYVLSELYAALATVELNHSTGKAKTLFRSSLVDPNENAVAQAQWATQYTGHYFINLQQFNSHEANTYLHMLNSDWESAFQASNEWLLDEPFSAEPSIRASNIASVALDNNRTAIDIARFGLRSNPSNFSLLKMIIRVFPQASSI